MISGSSGRFQCGAHVCPCNGPAAQLKDRSASPSVPGLEEASALQFEVSCLETLGDSPRIIVDEESQEPSPGSDGSGNYGSMNRKGLICLIESLCKNDNPEAKMIQQSWISYARGKPNPRKHKTWSLQEFFEQHFIVVR